MTDTPFEQHENHNPSEDSPISEYEVGYGRPPKDHQFQSGKSGNPNGRPKKKKEPELGETMRKILQEPTTVRIGKETLKMTRQETLLRSLIQQAVKGKVGAMKEIRQMIDSVTQVEDFDADNFDQGLLKSYLDRDSAMEGGDSLAKN